MSSGSPSGDLSVKEWPGIDGPSSDRRADRSRLDSSTHRCHQPSPTVSHTTISITTRYAHLIKFSCMAQCDRPSSQWQQNRSARSSTPLNKQTTAHAVNTLSLPDFRQSFVSLWCSKKCMLGTARASDTLTLLSNCKCLLYSTLHGYFLCVQCTRTVCLCLEARLALGIVSSCVIQLVCGYSPQEHTASTAWKEGQTRHSNRICRMFCLPRHGNSWDVQCSFDCGSWRLFRWANIFQPSHASQCHNSEK